jgi:hypothetical protein
VALHVTVVSPTDLGHLIAYPNDLPQPPETSTINFASGQTRANNTVAGLCQEGKLRLRPVLQNGGTVHLIADVVGYFIEQP